MMKREILDKGYSMGFGIDETDGSILLYDDEGEEVQPPMVAIMLSALATTANPLGRIGADYRYVWPIVRQMTDKPAAVVASIAGSPSFRHSMREKGLMFGAEAQGRYYYEGFWWSECSTLTIILLARMACCMEDKFSVMHKNLRQNNPVTPIRTWKVKNFQKMISLLVSELRETTELKLISRGLTGLYRSGEGAFHFCLFNAYDTLELSMEGAGDYDMLVAFEKEFAAQINELVKREEAT